MKKLLLTLLSLIALQGIARAEMVILTVDMVELYNQYETAKEAQDIYNADVERAQEEIRGIIEEGSALAADFKELVDKARNPALSAEARQKYTEEANALQIEIREKEEAVTKFRTQSQQVLRARSESMMELHVGELKAIVSEVAEEKGADLVLNTSGALSTVVFAKDSLDITSEVLTRINE